MRSAFDTELEQRLVRYAAIDSQSDPDRSTSPSTAVQLDMQRLLLAELEEMGARDVRLTDYGAVIATIPGNRPAAPVVGFLAHVDTAPAYAATGVRPRVHRAWDGSDIRFPDAPDLVLSPAHSPHLAGKVGCDIITASGATLLGADDKAGVAILMTVARHLLTHPELPRGDIRIAFTPDEEIGRGVDPRLPGDLGVAFAYTLDGARPGEIEYESFSADGAVIRVTGVSAHPGYARGRMVNALTLAARIATALPQTTMAPEVTEGREGFVHLHTMTGTAAAAELRLILRDFDRQELARKGAMLQAICTAVAATEPRATISCEITPQYRNMRDWLEQDMTPVDLARAACAAEGFDPVSVPIRGGTDGSRLTEMGVPTPNIFTGMQEIHGPLEWVCVQDMAAAVRVVLRLSGLIAGQGR